MKKKHHKKTTRAVHHHKKPVRVARREAMEKPAAMPIETTKKSVIPAIAFIAAICLLIFLVVKAIAPDQETIPAYQPTGVGGAGAISGGAVSDRSVEIPETIKKTDLSDEDKVNLANIANVQGECAGLSEEECQALEFCTCVYKAKCPECFDETGDFIYCQRNYK